MGLCFILGVLERYSPSGHKERITMKTIKAAQPALEPLTHYTVEFTTSNGDKERRQIAAADETAAAKAVRRYFAAEHVTGITRLGNVYVAA